MYRTAIAMLSHREVTLFALRQGRNGGFGAFLSFFGPTSAIFLVLKLRQLEEALLSAFF